MAPTLSFQYLFVFMYVLHVQTDKPVHAKYCENGFGHFLLSSGQQIHGQFNVQLRVLLKKLRKLLQKLRSQILPTFYQARLLKTTEAAHFDGAKIIFLSFQLLLYL